jgi:hypothetical protein
MYSYLANVTTQLESEITDEYNVLCLFSAINPQQKLKSTEKAEGRCKENISANSRVVGKLSHSGNGVCWRVQKSIGIEQFR